MRARCDNEWLFNIDDALNQTRPVRFYINFQALLLRISAKRERHHRILFSSPFSAPNDGNIQTRRRPNHDPTRATAPTEVPRLSSHQRRHRTIHHGLNRIFHNDTRGLRAGKSGKRPELVPVQALRDIAQGMFGIG